MKIVYLIDDFPPDTVSSSGLITLNLAQKMIKKGHQVFIITTVQNKELAGMSEYLGLKIYKLYSQYNEQWRAYLSLRNFQILKKIKEILALLKPDVCHFQHIHFYISYRSIKLAKKYAKKLFLTVHDAMPYNYGKLYPKNGSCLYKVKFWDRLKAAKKRFNPFREIIIKHYLKYFDRLFSISKIQKKILNINGIRNVTVIYNALDIESWQLNFKEVAEFKNKFNLNNRKIILFGGRLSGAKGGEMIVKAMVPIVKKIPQAALLVVGSNDEYAQGMVRLADSLDIKDKLIITGWLDRIEIKKAFYASDVCVTPSLCCDFFNLFNIEAGVAKKPVVGTCFGGTPEIILDGKTGYIINPNDYNLMADKIVDLLENPLKAKKFGEAGFNRIKKMFSDEVQVREILKWYKQSLN